MDKLEYQISCPVEQQFESRISILEEKTSKLETDMYFGQGKNNPPMTARLLDVERICDDLKKLKWYFIAAIVAMLVNLVGSHIKLG